MKNLIIVIVLSIWGIDSARSTSYASMADEDTVQSALSTLRSDRSSLNTLFKDGNCTIGSHFFQLTAPLAGQMDLKAQTVQNDRFTVTVVERTKKMTTATLQFNYAVETSVHKSNWLTCTAQLEIKSQASWQCVIG